MGKRTVAAQDKSVSVMSSRLAEFDRWFFEKLVLTGKFFPAPEVVTANGSKKKAKANMTFLAARGLIDKLLLFDNVRFGPTRWDSDLRIESTRKLAELSGKKPEDICTQDFRDFGVLQILSSAGGLIPALFESGLIWTTEEIKQQSRDCSFSDKKPYPWNLKRDQEDFWDNDLIIAATRWLIWVSGISVQNIKERDFDSRGLSYLVAERTGQMSYLLLTQAGYVYSKEEIVEMSRKGEFETKKVYPWQLTVKISGFWDCLDIDVATVAWICAQTNKKSHELISKDLSKNGCSGLLFKYDSSTQNLLVGTGVVYSDEEISTQAACNSFDNAKKYPWDIPNVRRGYWNERKNRLNALHWLASIQGLADPTELRSKHFMSGPLNSLFSSKSHYAGTMQNVMDDLASI